MALYKTKHIRLGVIIISSLLLINACASHPTPIPDNLSANAKIYQKKCSSCHSLPHPKRHTFSEWQYFIILMEQRMQEKKFPPLSVEEKQSILSYLKQHAR